MRILVDICHPGHVHFYKHAIWRLQDQGHEVLITAREKDVTVPLLKHYGFKYITLSKMGRSRWGLLREFLQREWALLRLILKFKPDVVTEIGGLFIAPVCWLLRKPSVVFTDSEPVPIDKYLTYPFATVICTPDCFMRDLGKRQVRYAGYHELAYLHPKYFQPDPTILDDLGVAEGEPYIVLRFVAWKASHDVGQSGFSIEYKRKLVSELEKYGTVFITSETSLPPEFEKYRVAVAPHRIHDVLYFSSVFIGDGATMATEAGLLGTPAVRASSLALTMGNFVELMEKYELVYSYYDPSKALANAISLLNWQDSKTVWHDKVSRFLTEKIDVTQFIVHMLCGQILSSETLFDWFKTRCLETFNHFSTLQKQK